MNRNYITPDAWSIIEDKFEADHVKSSESLFSIGNGAMGQRANFEEDYSAQAFKEAISVVFIILIKPALAGGKMVILNTLQRF